MDLISDCGRRVSIDELNTTRLLSHARKQAHQRGFDDILITRGDHFLWYPSLGKGGYGPARRVPIGRDAEKAPVVVFQNRYVAIFLADMSGDGLTDLVRIQNGSVCYWPNLGYGRFGAKVQMGGDAWFDHPERFDPRRIRLADVDGVLYEFVERARTVLPGTPQRIWIASDVTRSDISEANSFAIDASFRHGCPASFRRAA